MPVRQLGSAPEYAEYHAGIHERLAVFLYQIQQDPVSCFYLVEGIYSSFALKRVERLSGREPTFLLGPGGVWCGPATVEESLSGFGEDPRSR